MTWKPHFDKLILKKHADGKTVCRIAAELHTVESLVRAAHKRIGITPNSVDRSAEVRAKVKSQKRPESITVGPPAPRGHLHGDNPVATAGLILGTRLSWLRDVEMLDGTPCDLDRKMREANRVLFGRGITRENQLGRKPGWLWPQEVR
ncbi:MAG: hypothetical protein K8U57_36150 [Planctomycetes bacterium]|nr:hypothetical protein [Planctomycetota bacterium]